jgi:hypothetical protein
MITSESRKEPVCRSLRRAYAGWDLGRNGEERKLGVAGWLLSGENFLHEETPPVEKPTSFDMVIFKYTKKFLQPAIIINKNQVKTLCKEVMAMKCQSMMTKKT